MSPVLAGGVDCLAAIPAQGQVTEPDGKLDAARSWRAQALSLGMSDCKTPIPALLAPVAPTNPPSARAATLRRNQDMQPNLDPELIKKTFKDALVEVLHEERDALREVLTEIVEDTALANAIREGQRSEPVRRDAVFRIVEGKP
jgi:hypothetical protein